MFIRTLFLFTILYSQLFSKTFVVTTDADAGQGSFRQAILDANKQGGLDNIHFNIPGEYVHTIKLCSPLPHITSPVVVDASTQYQSAAIIVSSQTPLIQLDGTKAGNANGLVIACSGTTIKGFIISNFNAAGILIKGSNKNYILGNYIGTDSTASSAEPNQYGILIRGAASTNYIGSEDAADKNIISGNISAGLCIEGGKSNYVTGNYIGTDLTGILPIPNSGDGILINSPNNFIGKSNASNIISFNRGNGITVNSSDNKIQGNVIKANNENGILLNGSGNLIGGLGEGNSISENYFAGISVLNSNGNNISANSIFSNGEIGIDLNGDGITSNDSLDTDAGSNFLQNFAILNYAASDVDLIHGFLNSTPNSQFRIEFFTNSSAMTSGGENFVGAETIETDLNGNAEFIFNYPGKISPGQFVTSTVTDENFNTSEFSQIIAAEVKTKLFGNHFVVNRTYSGIPLHWQNGTSQFSNSNNIPSAFANSIVEGFKTWNTTLQSILDYQYMGISNSDVWGGDPDGINNNVWVTSNWNELTGSDENTISLARIRYNAVTGELTDVDIAYNDEFFDFTNNPAQEVESIDVQNAAAHEAGHFSGLGDIFNPDDEQFYYPGMGTDNHNETMYGLIKPGEILKRNLNPGDEEGIQYIYNNIEGVNLDLAILIDGSENYSGIYNAFTPAKNSILEILDKLRIGDRISVIKLPSTVQVNPTEIINETLKQEIKTLIQNMQPGGENDAGTGLINAVQLLQSNNSGNKRAIILFSSGENQTGPDPTQQIISSGAKVFSIGFMSSTGQNYLSSLAEISGGEYFAAANEMQISDKTSEIWIALTGLQQMFSKTNSSDDLIAISEPGKRIQGALIEKGMTRMESGIRWQGSSFVLTLIDPDGNKIDSSLAETNPDIDFISGSTHQYFVIRNPKPGNYELYVYGRVMPDTPEPITTYMVGNTDQTMDVFTNKQSYNVNEPVEIEVNLFDGGERQSDLHITGGEPITDADVIISILNPYSDDTLKIKMNEIGEGVYKTVFTETEAPGPYTFIVNASKGNFSRTKVFNRFFDAQFDSNAVLFALNSMWIRNGVNIKSGNTIVNSIANEFLNQGVELSIDQSTLPSGYSVKAKNIKINKGVVINSDVYFNSITNYGTINGEQISNLNLPQFFFNTCV